MTTITFNGKQYNCLEHMKEIKEKVTELFNKYYNKKQMFKDLVGKVRRDFRPNGDGLEEYNIETEEGDFGKFCGQRVYSGSWCYDIEVYKIEELDPNMYNEVESALDWDCFFVKDDNGQVYFIYTDVD